MLDRYYRNPIIYDYVFALLICLLAYYGYSESVLMLPKDEYTMSTTSDLSTIALTIAGFVLTLLTVLITFKTGSKIHKSNSLNNDDVPLLDMFFSSGLYFETTKHLKNAIKSLIFIAFIGFALKLFLNHCYIKYIFFADIFGLIIIVLSLLRSLLILSKIIELQKQE